MIVLGKRFSSSQRFVCLIEEIVLGNSLVGGMLCSRSTTSQGARRKCCGTEEKKHFNVMRIFMERKYAKNCSWKNCDKRLRKMKMKLCRDITIILSITGLQTHFCKTRFKAMPLTVNSALWYYQHKYQYDNISIDSIKGWLLTVNCADPVS